MVRRIMATGSSRWQSSALIAAGGPENVRRLLIYLASLVRPELLVLEPTPFPWQGLVRPPDQTVSKTVTD